MKHYHSIKALFPLDLGAFSDSDMKIEGEVFDVAVARAESVINEFFASSATITLSRWEREYGVIVPEGASDEDRHSLLQARILERGGLSRTYFVELAAALGYTIEISESPPMFRAGISKAGDRVYSSAYLWEWTVLVVNAHEAPELVHLFNDINPPHLRLTFVFA